MLGAAGPVRPTPGRADHPPSATPPAGAGPGEGRLERPRSRPGLPAALRLLDAEALSPLRRRRERAGTGGDRLAYVFFTSGSTGVLEGVEITHAQISVCSVRMVLVAAAGDTVLVGRTDPGRRLRPGDVGRAVGRGPAGDRAPRAARPRAVGALDPALGVTYAFFAAGFFEQVVRAALPDLAGMRRIAAGGGVMSPAAAAAVRSAHPRVRVPTDRADGGDDRRLEFQGDVGRRLLIPMGNAAGYEFHVLDEEGRQVGSPGHRGSCGSAGRVSPAATAGTQAHRRALPARPVQRRRRARMYAPEHRRRARTASSRSSAGPTTR